MEREARPLATPSHVPVFNDLNRTTSRFGTRGIVLRVLADATIVAFTYLMAFVARFLWIVWFRPDAASVELVQRYARFYVVTLPALLVITSAVFFAAGFYTFGRRYRGAHKAIVIVLASSVAYLVFIVGLFVIFDGPALPRAVPFIAWLMGTATMVASRLWARAWRRAVIIETRFRSENPDQESIEVILVIGGAGFIGSVVVRQLLDAGFSVVVMDAMYYGGDGIEAIRGHSRLFVIEADSRDVSSVAEAMRNVDAVIHLGEIVGDPACALDEQLTIEVNVLATRMLAEIARGYGIRRFVYASSCSVYGTAEDIVDEQSTLMPVSLYARSKIAAERAILSQTDQSFSPTVLRLSTVFGWSPRPRFDLVANLLAANATVDGTMSVFGGSQWRPFVHVDDVASAIIDVIQAPISLIAGDTFNVGSDECNSTILGLAEIVQTVVPESSIHVDLSVEDDRNYHVSFEKIHRVLGFEARWGLRRGIRQVVDALATDPIDIRDSRYSNLKTLSDPLAWDLVTGVDSVLNDVGSNSRQDAYGDASLSDNVSPVKAG